MEDPGKVIVALSFIASLTYSIRMIVSAWLGRRREKVRIGREDVPRVADDRMRRPVPLTPRASLFAILALAIGACDEGDADKRANLTQREKDSILAGSRIPGARAVKKSITSADSASARQARLDSAEREP